MEQLVFHVIPVENVWEQWNICNWFTVFQTECSERGDLLSHL